MAKRFVVVDDLDGTSEGAETVTLTIDNYDFEIDLGAANMKELREFMTPLIAAGRKAANGKRSVPPVWAQTQGPPVDTSDYVRTGVEPDPKTMRAWWHANWRVQNLNPPKAMGKIPAEVHEAFVAAQRVTDGLMKAAADESTYHNNVVTPQFRPVERSQEVDSAGG